MNEAQESWINDLALNVDIFMSGYCGYWLYGIDRIKGRGWLAYDQAGASDGERPSRARIEEVISLARDGLPLPKGWYLLDRAFAEKALAEGEKKYGEDFPEDYDGPMADVAVQRALLGEVLYG